MSAFAEAYRAEREWADCAAFEAALAEAELGAADEWADCAAFEAELAYGTLHAEAPWAEDAGAFGALDAASVEHGDTGGLCTEGDEDMLVALDVSAIGGPFETQTVWWPSGRPFVAAAGMAMDVRDVGATEAMDAGMDDMDADGWTWAQTDADGVFWNVALPDAGLPAHVDADGAGCGTGMGASDYDEASTVPYAGKSDDDEASTEPYAGKSDDEPKGAAGLPDRPLLSMLEELDLVDLVPPSSEVNPGVSSTSSSCSSDSRSASCSVSYSHCSYSH